MKILADENIPHVRESFADLGDVETCPGRLMTADRVRCVDALFIRSVTEVNERLLSGSRVAYVGSATSGVEHIDVDYLGRKGIGFSQALGSNANSVAEYVVAAVLEATLAKNVSMDGLSCGIVGYGQVGSRVFEKLTALGVTCYAYDPPLAEGTKDPFFCDGDRILDCDIITFHTPLTDEGPYPTRHMLNEESLTGIKSETILINASRGGVMDTEALIRVKRVKPELYYVFDVWEQEPVLNTELLGMTEIATPHIAGYSWDAKVAGTRMVKEGFCKYFTLPFEWNQPADPPSSISRDIHIDSESDAVRSLVRHAYPILRDDRILREAVEENSGTHGAAFDRLRRDYAVRREFPAFNVDLTGHSAEVVSRCQALGFTHKH